jgi:hypothetical protein
VLTPIPQWSWSTGGGWALTAHDNVSGTETNRLIRGVRTTYSTVFSSTSGTYNRFTLGAGESDELAALVVSGQMYYFDASNVPHIAGSGSTGYGRFERIGSTRNMIQPRDDLYNVVGTTDYRSAAWAALTGVSGQYAAALAAGTVFMGGRSGVQQVLTPLATPSISIVAASGESVGHIRSDRQSQTIAAATVGSGLKETLIRSTDGTWSRISAPPDAIVLLDWVEVVQR